MRMWRGFLTVEDFPQVLIEAIKKVKCLPAGEFIKLINGLPGNIPCLTDEIEIYQEDDCSEVNKLRKCMWDNLRNRNWDKAPPNSFVEIIKSVTPKEYVFPSERVLRALKIHAGQNYFPKCFFNAFAKVRYCREACPDCDE